jgi:hypothetical protein
LQRDIRFDFPAIDNELDGIGREGHVRQSNNQDSGANERQPLSFHALQPPLKFFLISIDV